MEHVDRFDRQDRRARLDAGQQTRAAALDIDARQPLRPFVQPREVGQAGWVGVSATGGVRLVSSKNTWMSFSVVDVPVRADAPADPRDRIRQIFVGERDLLEDRQIRRNAVVVNPFTAANFAIRS